MKAVISLNWLKRIGKYKWFYILLVPGFVYFLLFRYVPMWGTLISFKNYQPFLGFFHSQWVGLDNFKRLFGDPDFLKLFRNTIVLAFYNLLFFFPLPIILALLMNEVRHSVFKRLVQTISYIPHFFSWVIVASLTYTLFMPDYGIFSALITQLTGNRIDVISNAGAFRGLITIQSIYKEVGWGTILFLSALSGIQIDLYEAAEIDGAGRWQQLLHITIPALKATMITLFVLRLGNFLDNGFEQIWLMINSGNRETAEVFDTYIYEYGLKVGDLSYTTAIGLFKSVLSLFLIVLTNKAVKKMGEEGIF